MMLSLPVHSRGFTLIELIVSVAIFSVVSVIALGGLLSISAGERKAETFKSVMNNLNFALESMSRTIRTGTDYGCNAGGDCSTSNGGYKISFKGSETGAPIYTYCLSAGTNSTTCNTSTTCPTIPTAQRCSILRSIDGSAYIPLTAPEVNIKKLAFYVVGSPLGSTGDKVQPKVTISIAGEVQVAAARVPTAFNLQTTVTQRLYDQ